MSIDNLSDQDLFYFQIQIVLADTLKIVTDSLLLQEYTKKYIRQDVKKGIAHLKGSLDLYSKRINGNGLELIGGCGQFADTLIDFLHTASKDKAKFEEVFGLMAAYNKGELVITEG